MKQYVELGRGGLAQALVQMDVDGLLVISRCISDGSGEAKIYTTPRL